MTSTPSPRPPFFPLLGLLLALLLPACGKEAPPPPVEEAPPVVSLLAAARARGTLRFGTEIHSPPMTFKGSDDRPTGFEVRIMEAIAAQLGLKAEIVPVTWTSHVQAVQSGVVDAVVGGWIPNDVVGMASSSAYLESGLCLVVRKDSGIRDLASLAGKKVGLHIDPAAQAWAKDRLTASELVPVEDGYFDLLAAGQLDAVVYDYPFVVGEIVPWAEQLRIVELNLFPFRYAAMLSPSAPDLKLAFDEAIAAVRASDAYRGWIDEFLTLGGPGAQVLDLPMLQASPGQELYTVKKGDTLRSVAAALYDDPARWTDLWRLNKDRVALPEFLPPGTRLVLP